VVSWVYLVAAEGVRPDTLLAPETWQEAGRFLRGFIGQAEDGSVALARGGTPAVPAYQQPARWREMARLAGETLAMSVLAIAIAFVGMLLTVIPGAHTAASGELLLTRRSPLWPVLYVAVRALYLVTRSVPELVWALLLVFLLSPGILPGALALGLHNLGVLGKLCAEVVEDLDRRPVRALRAAGAGPGAALFYGVLPAALPQFLTFTLYRWEVIIRTTIVVGFVSAGGLGREFRLAMSFFHYTDVALILATYLLLVLGVDALSAWLRRLAA
jgi:phosphonate transport system permease protein